MASMEGLAASEKPAVSDPVLCIAQATLGDMTIGIDTRFVVHAISRPAWLVPLPRSHDAIDGVLAAGEDVVPVVDLRRWMGVPTTPDDVPCHVMVLKAHERTVGLAIDKVCGVVRVPQSRVKRVHQSDTEDGFFHSVVQTQDGALLSLLDPERFMKTVQAWTDNSTRVEKTSHASDAATGIRSQQMYALVQFGDKTLGVPTGYVVEVLTCPSHQSLMASNPHMIGMIEWRNNPIPLVDLSTCLGMAPSAPTLAMVVVQGRSQVAVLINSVLEVLLLDDDPSATGTGEAIGSGSLVRELTVMSNRRIILLDSDALLSRFAAPGLIDAENAGTRSQKATSLKAYAIYNAGRNWAIPMLALEEILRHAGRPAGKERNSFSVPPTLVWRNQTLLVVDLRDQLIKDAKTNLMQYCVMVARCQSGHIAFIVHDMVGMLSVAESDVLSFQVPGGKRAKFITTSQDGSKISYPVIDFDDMNI